MIYLSLVAIILVSSFLLNGRLAKEETAKKRIVILSFLLLIVVFSFRSISVGRDISGYKYIYDFSLKADFFRNDYFEYSGFESGYVFFMKICCKLGFDFQLFLTICALIALIPVAVFIYRFSSDVTLSILVFICYLFLEFYLSALRQSISISIFLIGLSIYLLKRRGYIFWYYIFSILAFLFHTGAIICFFVPFLSFIKKSKYFFVAALFITVVLLIFRNDLISIIGSVFSRNTDYDSNFYIGTNSIFLIAITVLMIIINEKKYKAIPSSFSVSEGKTEYLQTSFFINMLIVSICLGVFFGTSHIARASMYLFSPLMLLVPKIPNISNVKGEQKIIKAVVVVFFTCYFLYSVLVVNDLKILPYSFFWE